MPPSCSRQRLCLAFPSTPASGRVRTHASPACINLSFPLNSFSKLLFSCTVFLGCTRAVVACDTCAVYFARGADRAGFTLSTAHQFTRLGSVWHGDRRLGNPVDQYVDSHITQLSLGYTQGGAWHAQLTLPYISRSFVRPDHALIERGRESGLGDLTLAGRYRVWQFVGASGGEFQLSLLGGVEFGTGDSDRLGDAVGHHHHHHANFPDSGIHGHDLALGSGSTDWLVGADAGWKRGRLFGHVQWQRKLRRVGSFDYRIANETSLEASAGGYVLLTHEHSLALQALFSADRKGLDSLAGAVQPDTAASIRYLGARVTGTLGRRFEADAALELPVRIRTSETMVVPDYRIRAACNWRF